VHSGYTQREALLHLLFPDAFEDIVAHKAKDRIVRVFSDLVTNPEADRDRQLVEIRAALAKEHGEFTFYDRQIAKVWKKDRSPWGRFVEWAAKFYEWEDFGNQERTYKLQIAEKVASARESLLAGQPAWEDELRRSFGAPNNLTYYITHSKFLAWVKENPVAAESALRRLWRDADDLMDNIEPFLAEVPHDVLGTPGEKVSITSFLLAGVDPTVYPFYKATPFKAAYKLAGYLDVKKSAGASEIYRHGLAFLDTFIEQASERGLDIADRLDAQSLAWSITSGDLPEAVFDAPTRKKFKKYQSGAPVDDEDDREPVAVDTEVSEPAPPRPLALGDAAFSPRAFQLLRGIDESRSREYYLGHKAEFVAEVEQPFQDLMSAVVAKLPEQITSRLETEKNLFGRFLKNDWGRGGAWEFYWGALYRKGGRRVEGAQLYMLLRHETLRFGLSFGQHGSEEAGRFLSNWAATKAQLIPRLRGDWKGIDLEFGRGEEEHHAGDSRSVSFDQWAADPSAVGMEVYVTLTADELQRMKRGALADRVADTFKALFPLFLLAIEDEPAAILLTEMESPEEREQEIQPEHTLEVMARETHFDAALLERWVAAIERKKQAVVYGPPGTGKTFLAEHLARHLIGGGDGFRELVQFHPAYAYEDFIQGIRPRVGSGGGLNFEMVKGRLLDFCARASARTGRCVLVIDEINRANLSRVFGELMYLLEYRGEKVPLAGGGTLRVPDNVRILGTMNTADRSIALVDHALRRRFAFLHLRPDTDVLRSYHARKGGTRVDGLISVLDDLNKAIQDPHYEVGISFFLREDLPAHIEAIWRQEIEPYLEEYFFDQADKLEAFRWSKIAGKIGL
jgi:5-methylcytosine-specific restriction protein B